jgi:DNA-binding GntR family transcriptional regulator
MAFDLRQRCRRFIEQIENGEISLITDDRWLPNPLDDLVEERLRVLDGMPNIRQQDGLLSTIRQAKCRGRALGMLADEGLVVVKIPRRGAFVPKVSAKGRAEIASLRKRLEPYAIELALPGLTRASRIKITRALEDMAISADNNDRTGTIDAHMAFHRAFYELSGHKLLLDLWNNWKAPLQTFFSADRRAFADLHDMAADHQRLLSIIDTGDPDAITREIAVHLHGPTQPEIPAESKSPPDA